MLFFIFEKLQNAGLVDVIKDLNLKRIKENFCAQKIFVQILLEIQLTEHCGTPEGAFSFRYLLEKTLKQGNKNGNQNKKDLVYSTYYIV